MGPISETKYITNAGWDDAPHLTDAEKKAVEDITPAHLLPAAKYGIPVSVVGRILPWDFKRIACDPFVIPAGWPKVFGFDPSVNRTAALWAALDEQTDTAYLYSEYFGTHQIPRLHVQTIQTRGSWMTGLCDPSAEQKTIDGKQVVKIYRTLGLNLVYADNAVTAGIKAIIDRVTSGRLKAFSTLAHFQFEWNNYRRDKHGKIVKEHDDLLDALRYICLGGFQYAAVSPQYLQQRTGASAGGGVADERAGF